jgi:hypothetical protein
MSCRAQLVETDTVPYRGSDSLGHISIRGGGLKVRTLMGVALLIAGTTTLSLATSDNLIRGNAYGQTDKTDRSKDKNKVYAVPETLNSGPAILILLLLYSGGLLVRKGAAVVKVSRPSSTNA